MNAKGHDDRKHAPLPPSASSRWLECAPSQGYIKALIKGGKIKKRESGPAAQRGTRIHEIAEPWLKALLAGKRYVPPKKADHDEVDEAKAYVEFCVSKYYEAQVLDKDVRWGVEAMAQVDDDNWGTVDFWLLSGKRLTTIDLKSGRDEVKVDGNTQLLDYLLGLVRRLKIEANEFEVCVWQPNADSEVPARSKIYTQKEFTDWTQTFFLPRLEKAKLWLRAKKGHEDALIAGDWCSWCDALGVCPVARAKATEISQTNFMPVPVERMQMPDPAKLEPDIVSQIKKRAAMFLAWLEAVDVRAMELIHKGHVVPGFKVVPKQTRRAWESRYTDVQIANKLKLKSGQVTKVIRLSPAQVEELLDKAGKERLKKLVFKPVGDPTVVPDSDRRQALPSTKFSFTPVSKLEDDDG